MIKQLLLTLSLLLFISPAWASAHSQQDNTQTTLVTKQNALVAGQPLNAGLLLEAKDGWHTYWENPGDAGMATTFTWTLPPGFTASAIDWPAPQRMTEGPLVTFSYQGKTLLPVTITPPATLDNNVTYPIKLKAEWLVCKDICVPESTELQIMLPVAPNNPLMSADAPLFSAQNHIAAIEAPGQFTAGDEYLTLSIPLSALPAKNIASVLFFPREQNIVNYAAEQKFTIDKDILNLVIERAGGMPGGNVSGIIAVTDNTGIKTHYNVTFSPSSAAATSPKRPAEDTLWFPTALLFALIGGLVLNLMPCVLPVLSLKALAIAKKSGKEHRHVVFQAIAYTLGILLSFACIAGLLIALRQAGQSVGWGYQMQSPAFVGFLIYLLFMVGLSLSGLFHLPVLFGRTGPSGEPRHTLWASFFTGILATAVATPCTAPFMASAVGAALTLPAFQSLLIFEALGFGLALPFLLICLFPHLLRFLPKPGAWMDTFKQFLAFPMYASVIWLIWVLTLQTGAGGTVLVLTGILAIVIAIWAKSLFVDGSPSYRTIALLTYALILLLSLPMLNRMEITTISMPDNHGEQEIQTIAYSKEKLAELRAAGTPVFIDATAAWCITCQINARVALHTTRTMEEFKKQGIVLMIADWTRRNDDITEFLSGFGYKGVPLCVFYPAGNEKPIILPQILTENTVIAAITQKGK